MAKVTYQYEGSENTWEHEYASLDEALEHARVVEPFTKWRKVTP